MGRGSLPWGAGKLKLAQLKSKRKPSRYLRTNIQIPRASFRKRATKLCKDYLGRKLVHSNSLQDHVPIYLSSNETKKKLTLRHSLFLVATWVNPAQIPSSLMLSACARTLCLVYRMEFSGAFHWWHRIFQWSSIGLFLSSPRTRPDLSIPIIFNVSRKL